MGNVTGSFFSGLGSVINQLLGSPLDFLAGKSCSSVCGSTWDFICYIENFCVAHLLKFATVLVLLYFVLLFFYLLYNLGICECISRCLCRVVWACFSTCFTIVEYGCTFLCYKLPRLKRKHRRHKRDIEEFNSSSADEEESNAADHRRYLSHLPRKTEGKRSVSRHWRNYNGDRLRKSLRPKSHRVHMGIRRDLVRAKKINSMKYGVHGNTLSHDIRVTRTSKFAQKGNNSYKGSSRRKRRKCVALN